MPQEITNEQIQPQQKKRWNSKKLFIGVGIIAIFTIATFAVIFFMSHKLKDGNTPSAKESEIGPLVEAGEFTTNLAPGGEKKYVKVKVVLELDDQSLVEQVEKKLPVLQDRILVFLNSKTSDDLSSQERSNLKKEILSDLNRYITDGEIKNIYFSDLVMQ